MAHVATAAAVPRAGLPPDPESVRGAGSSPVSPAARWSSHLKPAWARAAKGQRALYGDAAHCARRWTRKRTRLAAKNARGGCHTAASARRKYTITLCFQPTRVLLNKTPTRLREHNCLAKDGPLHSYGGCDGVVVYFLYSGVIYIRGQACPGLVTIFSSVFPLFKRWIEIRL